MRNLAGAAIVTVQWISTTAAVLLFVFLHLGLAYDVWMFDHDIEHTLKVLLLPGVGWILALISISDRYGHFFNPESTAALIAFGVAVVCLVVSVWTAHLREHLDSGSACGCG
jgi:hypothetical protein